MAPPEKKAQPCLRRAKAAFDTVEAQTGRRHPHPDAISGLASPDLILSDHAPDSRK